MNPYNALEEFLGGKSIHAFLQLLALSKVTGQKKKKKKEKEDEECITVSSVNRPAEQMGIIALFR